MYIEDALSLVSHDSFNTWPNNGLRLFPKVLFDILQSPGLNEIYGPAGSGKTTLAISAVVHYLSLDEKIRTLYICCDGRFPIIRLMHIISGANVAQQSIMDRLLVQHIGDISSLEHFCCYLLPAMVEQLDIKLVVVDSIASNFRSIDSATEILKTKYVIAHRLSCVNFSQGCSSVMINQITADWSVDGGVASQWSFLPCLGQSWANCISKSICMSKRQLDEHTTICNLSLVRCPFIGTLEITFHLAEEGIVWDNKTTGPNHGISENKMD